MIYINEHFKRYLNLFLLDDKTSLLENLVALHLCRCYGKENVFYYNSGKEIDFVVSEARIAIQVSYSIKGSRTYTREVTPLFKFAQAHPDWTLQIVTYEEEDSLNADGTIIHVVPAYKWLLT